MMIVQRKHRTFLSRGVITIIEPQLDRQKQGRMEWIYGRGSTSLLDDTEDHLTTVQRLILVLRSSSPWVESFST
eukprot:scaffold108_cov162-Amphora_coffeaeformis.AAC.7